MNRNSIIFVLCAIGLSLLMTACPSPVPPITWTVTFDSGDADTAASPSSLEASGTDPANVTLKTLPSDPIKEASGFRGWFTEANGGGTEVTVDTPITESLTVYAHFTPYELRDVGPAGGYIFYINPNAETDGWTYMECAPAEAMGSATGPEMRWGVRTFVSGANHTAIGTGKSNTEAIVTATDKSDNTDAYAAKFCDELEYRGFTDWFLPSTLEFGEMYSALIADESGPEGIATGTDCYWTSTERPHSNSTYNDKYAYLADLTDGSFPNIWKSNPYYVWAIRRF